MSRAQQSPLLWPLAELIDAYAARTLSPVEVVREALDRISAHDAPLGAYLTVCEDLALAQAAEAERAYAAGQIRALLGVPLSIKDLFDVAGVRTTFGSLAHAADVAVDDSPAVARLRDAGAVFLGKTNTAEFGQSATTETLVGPPAANPWDPERTAGGSSGGAAASVAAGLAAAALGSDGGGSIRIPAAFCGLFGLKPTQGAAPDGGRFRAMSDFACAGPITRRVGDARPFLAALTGDRVPPQTAPPRLRVAWCPALEGHPVDPEVARTVQSAVEELCRLGRHELVDAAPPLEGWREVFGVLVLAEEWRERGVLLRHPEPPLTRYARAALEAGERITPAQVDAARAELARMRAGYTRYFEDTDLIATPATAVPAFPIGRRPREIAGRPADRLWGPFPFTPQFNVAGLPAASVPAGLVGGLPVALQLVARPGAEAVLLDVCEGLEEALAFDASAPARRRPAPHPALGGAALEAKRPT
jgi:Asp-tRNA(Asn)/Glu-tRNA(Gln) amidotransferase A subunit family amidase